jgi:hypothetical protein
MMGVDNARAPEGAETTAFSLCLRISAVGNLACSWTPAECWFVGHGRAFKRIGLHPAETGIGLRAWKKIEDGTVGGKEFKLMKPVRGGTSTSTLTHGNITMPDEVTR